MKELKDILAGLDREKAPVLPAMQPERDTGCERCQGTGFVVVVKAYDHSRFGHAEPCKACTLKSDKAKRADVLERVQVPSQYRHLRLTHWDVPYGGAEPLKAAGEYVEAWPPKTPLLLLLGGPGRGKTHLAAVILGEVYDRHGKLGVFWRSVDLMARYRASYGDHATETSDKVTQSLRDADLVVLDDLGSENDTGNTREKVFDLVDYRYSEGKPLVVTTNASKEDMPAKLWSRLGSGTVVLCRGKDHRGAMREVV